ncbi:MAG: hypothetical protein ABJG88_11415 [Litorimonas sp.]
MTDVPVDVKRMIYAEVMVSNIQETVGYNKPFSAYGYNVSNWTNTHIAIIESGVATATGGELHFLPEYIIHENKEECREFFLSQPVLSMLQVEELIKGFLHNTAHRSESVPHLCTFTKPFAVAEIDREIMEVFVAANYAEQDAGKYKWTDSMGKIFKKMGHWLSSSVKKQYELQGK